jgi:hypothetical protein
VDGRDVSTDGGVLDNLNTTLGLGGLIVGEVNQLKNINSTTISTAQWGYVGGADQAVATTSTPTFAAITVTGNVDGRDVSTDGGVLDNLNTTLGLGGLIVGEVNQLKNINSTTISTAQWGYVGGADQAVATTSSPTFAAITVTGNVDGRDISVDGSVLDTLDALGLDGLTGAEVTQLKEIGVTTISASQWGYVGGADQAVATTSTPTFAALDVSGKIDITNIAAPGAPGANIGSIYTRSGAGLYWHKNGGAEVDLTAGGTPVNRNYDRTVVAASTYAILETDCIVAVTYTGTGAVTLTLPTISGLPGGKLRVKIVDEGANASVNNITINRGGTDTILGGSNTSFLISGDANSVTMYSDGTSKWFIA